MDQNNRSFQFSFVSPVCLLRALFRNFWMIVATALVFAMTTTFALHWFYVPQYQATMTYAVNSRTTSALSSGNLTSTREVAAVLSELVETDLMREGISATDPRLTGFSGTITAEQVGDSNFIVVNVTASTPEEAFLALDALVDVFPAMADYIANRSVLNILQNPTVSSTPSNLVNTTQTAQIAALVGAILMIGLLCFFSVRGETIQTRTGARQMLDAPILASVNREWKNRTLKTILKNTNKQVQVFAPTTSFSYNEQISTICSQLEHEANARGRKVFMFTGVGESEGKSTIAGNVAAALAMKGHNVALVDADLRKPALNRFFEDVYSSEMPLNKMLGRPYSKENLLSCMMRHEQMSLYMLFATSYDSRSAELVSGETMTAVLEQLRVFDFVIVDTPPMGMFPDAEILADKVDASLLVVRQDYTAACDVNDAIDGLRRYKSDFLGVILNDMLETFRDRYGYGNKYGVKYGGRYGYGKYGYGKNPESSQKGEGEVKNG
ncbi:MAG: polysaccharide biosynthesis tyrosine autokinase [Ruminococcaceae bacterium]|nr:polysaccharide biosynthesis tyrosine autokinase [Oscillospiraceae bacterium]